MRKLFTIWTIAKKELSRFFRDRRICASLFLPGILIYLIYSVLGGVIMPAFGVQEDYTYRVCVVNSPVWLTEELTFYGNFDIQETNLSEEEALEKIKNEDLDAYLVFPNGFSLENAGAMQEVTLFIDSTRTESQTAGQLLSATIATRQYDAPKFLLTAQDIATEEDLSSMILSMIGPMLVLIMLMTGCIAVAPESIAGEKERGTLATILATPVKRSHIALGKVLALSAIALLSGLCSFLGIMLALPKLMGGDAPSLKLSLGAGEYFMILGVVLSSVLLMVSLVSVISAFAKSVKEAVSYGTPVMIVVLVAALASSFLPMNEWFFFCIPFLNSAAVLGAAFSMAANPLYLVITVAVNLIAAALLAFGLTKMFDSEKIMFGK